MNDLPQLTDPATWKDCWQTRDGRLAEIAWDNMRGDYPLGGRIEDGDHNWVLCVWKRNGCFRLDEEAHATDLIPRPKKHSGFVVFERLPEGGITGTTYARTVPPNVDGRSEVIAVVPYSFTEGDGLEGAK